jgi:hypothetical protein
MVELIEGHVYQATLPRNRQSPRENKIERISGNKLSIWYGWFGYSDGENPSPEDPWTWSPRGIESVSRYDFVAQEDLGPAPEEGEPRSSYPWAMRAAGL